MTYDLLVLVATLLMLEKSAGSARDDRKNASSASDDGKSAGGVSNNWWPASLACKPVSSDY